MGGENKKDDPFKVIEILKNATIIYNDGDRELFEALRLTDNGAVFGRIIKIHKTDHNKVSSINDYNEIFMESGGIPKDNVKHIEGGSWKTVYNYKK